MVPDGSSAARRLRRGTGSSSSSYSSGSTALLTFDSSSQDSGGDDGSRSTLTSAASSAGDEPPPVIRRHASGRRKMAYASAALAMVGFLVVFSQALVSTYPSSTYPNGEGSGGDNDASIDDDRGGEERSAPRTDPPYGGLSCPLEDPAFALVRHGPFPSSSSFLRPRSAHLSETVESDLLRRAEAAREYSAASMSAPRIRAALGTGSFDSHRTVMVGDLAMRQYFIGWGCGVTDLLSGWIVPYRTSDVSDVADAAKAAADVVGGSPMIVGEGAFVPVDGRFNLVGSRSEVLYSPHAGELMTYDRADLYGGGGRVGGGSSSSSSAPDDVSRPPSSWLEACRDLRPFTVTTHSCSSNCRGAPPGPPLTVPLTRGDTVFLNAGSGRHREGNLSNVQELLKCVEVARSEGRGHPDWPRLHYIVTSSDHYPEGKGVGSGTVGGCAAENQDLGRQMEDVSTFGSLVVGGGVVGNRLDLRRVGELHVGRRPPFGGGGPAGPQSGAGVEGADCSGWLQPGVPDAVAAEMAEAVVRDDEERRARKVAGGIASARKVAQQVPQEQVPQEQVLQEQVQMQQEVQVQPELKAQQQLEAPPQAPEQQEWQQQLRQQQPQTPPSLPQQQTHGPKPLCPFAPDDGSKRDHTAESISTSMEPFDPGLLSGLVELIPPGSSVLDLFAGVGQLYEGLVSRSSSEGGAGGDGGGVRNGRGVVVDYLGLDSYRNVMELTGQTFRLKDGSAVAVPSLCWADPSRHFDMERKFDYVVAIVGGGYYIPPQGRQAFLDNLVRTAGKAVIVAWRSPEDAEGDGKLFDVVGEMRRRGCKLDKGATKKLADKSKLPFLKGFVKVFRVEEGRSRPIIM